MKTYKKYISELKKIFFIKENNTDLMSSLLSFSRKYIKKKDFIALSSAKEVLQIKKYDQRKISRFPMKPNGFWFGIGSSWIDWLEHEQPDWANPTVLKLHLNLSKMFEIKNKEDIAKFNRSYAMIDKHTQMWTGNWEKMSKDYDGIVFWMGPPFASYPDSPLYIWYGWDVASGVVWNSRAIKKIEMIGQYDYITKQYIRK